MATFTLVHVILSLLGIGSGLVVIMRMLGARGLGRTNVIFLASTGLTSVTGFLFPVHKFMPSHGVGIVSLLVLAVAIFALYRRHLSGGWARVYAVAAVIAEYLNVFVLIAQLFMKVPALKALAPTQSELPFKLAQLLAFVIFASVAVVSAIRYRAAQSDKTSGAQPARAA